MRKVEHFQPNIIDTECMETYGDRRMTEWNPTEEDVEWTKGIVEGLEMGQDWMEGEMAFRRTGDATLTLLTRTERAESAMRRVEVVLQMIGWHLEMEQAKIIPDDPQLAAEMMQKEAQSWLCPGCEGCPVIDMGLEDGVWQVIGNTHHVDEGGDVISVDRWVVGLACPDCEEMIYLSPDDYYLIAGEHLFYTWEGWFPIQPEQIAEAVDKGYWDDLNARPLGSSRGGKPVPPHMRGLICIKKHGEEEE
jgi:hypothetical protein